MSFEETKAMMEQMGFKFEWCDKDIEGIEEDEDTGKERKVTIHAKGWYVKHPSSYYEEGFHYPTIFVPIDEPHPEAYLNVILERYGKRYDEREEEARVMKHLEEHFNTYKS